MNGIRRGQRSAVSRHVVDGVPLFARWGRVQVTPYARLMGHLEASLHIYPPGTSRGERVKAGVAGLGMSMLGFMVAAIAAFVGVWLGGWFGAAGALVVCVSLWVWAMRASAGVRQRTHVISFTKSARGEGGQLDRFVSIGAQLDALDADRGVSPVVYELWWARIYDETATPEVH